MAFLDEALARADFGRDLEQAAASGPGRFLGRMVKDRRPHRNALRGDRIGDPARAA
jgi:hypothetical protein